jgi:hypothetical protein
MADLDYGSYTGAASNSELLSLPDKTSSVKGQAGFLAMALAFSHLAASGSGLSFNVSGNPRTQVLLLSNCRMDLNAEAFSSVPARRRITMNLAC